MSGNGGKRRRSGGRRQAIINQIQSWIAVTNFAALGGQDIDQVVAGIDFEAEVDSTLPARQNWEIIKDKFNLVTKGELQELIRAREEQEVERVREEIRDQLETYGIEDVADAINQRPGAPPDLQRRVDDVLDEYPPDVYDVEIANEVAGILDVLGGDFRVAESQRLERLEEEAQAVRDPVEARQEVLNEFERAFGQRFDDVGDAVRSIRERIEQARGERLEIAPIMARRAGESIRVQIADGEAFQEFEELVSRRVRRGIAFGAEEPRVNTEVGEISLRGGELEAIDLTAGVERFGHGEPEIPIEERIPRRQTPLPVEESEADRLALRAIETLRGGG